MSVRATTKHDIQRDEGNITRPGFDVITNILVSGSISMSYTGVDQGTGQVVLYSPATSNGWITENNTWTCISTDSPIFNVSINANVTGTVGMGNKIWLTQSGQSKYFSVHGVGITGSTSYLNLYGGTDYSLVTGSITSPFYSNIKAPFGFPLNPDKWSVTVEDTTAYLKTNPVNGTWYSAMDSGNLPSINIPIGAWRVYWEAAIYGERTTGAFRAAVVGTLSNSNSAESNKQLTAVASMAVSNATSGDVYIYNAVFKEYPIVLTAKTTYYMLLKAVIASQTYVGVDNTSTTVLKAVDAYL